MADSQWYYAQNNQQFGPVTIQALIEMLRQGHVRPTDLVWTESMADWLPASTVPQLISNMQATAVVTPGVAVAPIANASINYFTPTYPNGNVAYAGFWLRFVAYIIDYIIIEITVFILAFLTGMSSPMFFPMGRGLSNRFFLGSNVLSILIVWLYFALMESSKIQATVGKLAVGLFVTDTEGRPIGFGRATGRFFGKYISGIILCIGYMMAGWTERKQALHDMMANTLVLRKP